ncbi:MAG: hypothetical protein HDT27_01900 [Subdoligranulum sp.]|nr:hypothetical protein [Subdoligranulum sp.]
MGAPAAAGALPWKPLRLPGTVDPRGSLFFTLSPPAKGSEVIMPYPRPKSKDLARGHGKQFLRKRKFPDSLYGKNIHDIRGFSTSTTHEWVKMEIAGNKIDFRAACDTILYKKHGV